MDYDFLKQLIASAEQFEQQRGDNSKELSLNEFALWLHTKHETSATKDARFGDADFVKPAGGESIETNIGRLIIYMYRYARMYTKKALEGTALQTADEFGYLATLLTHDCLKKSDLIAKNIHEKPTGMEIIKRLMRNGLIDQFDDTEDKRSKLLRINDKGKVLLYTVFGRMGKVSDIIGGNLDMEEKMHLLFLLKKLDDHHHHIFIHEKEEVLNTIV